MHLSNRASCGDRLAQHIYSSDAWEIAYNYDIAELCHKIMCRLKNVVQCAGRTNLPACCRIRNYTYYQCVKVVRVSFHKLVIQKP